MINNLAFIRSAEGVQKWMSERNLIYYSLWTSLRRTNFTFFLWLAERYKDPQISVINHGTSSRSALFMLENVFVEDLNGAINL